MYTPTPAKVAVLSDTHGALSSAAASIIEAFGPSFIVHAGDVGGPHILIELESVAPVVAVRGNTDHGAWADDLPGTATVMVGENPLVVVHDLSLLDDAPTCGVVVSGHTHIPVVSHCGGVLHVNPGSVSRPRTAGRIPTLAFLEFGAGAPIARIVNV